MKLGWVIGSGRWRCRCTTIDTGSSNGCEESTRAQASAVNLSEEASELLLEVSRDPVGLILRLTALGGSSFLKTNGRAFGDGSPDAQARWESGVRQLLGVGLIEPQGHRVFCITPEGYRAADVLQRRK